MKMLFPLFFLSIGFIIGYCFRKYPLRNWLSKIIGNVVYILLFLLGLSLGSSKDFYENIAELGTSAFLFSFVCTIGSLIGARITYKLFFEKKDTL